MSEIVEANDQKQLSEELFHVVLHDGSRFAVSAAGFEHKANPEDLMVFLKPDGTANTRLFLRARAVDLIAAESDLTESRFFTELQNRVTSLEGRVAALEMAAAVSDNP